MTEILWLGLKAFTRSKESLYQKLTSDNLHLCFKHHPSLLMVIKNVKSLNCGTDMSSDCKVPYLHIYIFDILMKMPNMPKFRHV